MTQKNQQHGGQMTLKTFFFAKKHPLHELTSVTNYSSHLPKKYFLLFKENVDILDLVRSFCCRKGRMK